MNEQINKINTIKTKNKCIIYDDKRIDLFIFRLLMPR